MGKTIVIIGAGPGVGFAVAQRFGKEGYNVALLARSEEKLDNLVKQLEAQEISVASFYADVLVCYSNHCYNGLTPTKLFNLFVNCYFTQYRVEFFQL
ncbi:MAG: SDR family NAD(P)-dependent oxidoreductase [Pedobacter sp.]|nr:MAG: SDR family NAD(P)-dependent oxidoreductase [Pedobacter sp.]